MLFQTKMFSGPKTVPLQPPKIKQKQVTYWCKTMPSQLILAQGILKKATERTEETLPVYNK